LNIKDIDEYLELCKELGKEPNKLKGKTS